MKGSSLPIKTIHELKAEAEKICGKPQKARLTDEVIAVINWVDGTAIDSVFRVDK
jgi:citrate lyase subunit alpha/citrate CoA-transferase